MSKQRNSLKRIGIDLMGSDLAPSDLLLALESFPKEDNIELVLIGTPDLEQNCSHSFYATEEFISVNEHPIEALRRKKGASMLLGLRLLKEKKLDALISAGSTPALVVGAKTILSSLPGIHRPALLSYFPTKKNPVAVLDLGANVQCNATHFVQFAQMVSAYLSVQDHANPRLGLLNIGEEPLKGTSELRLAYHMLQTYEKPPFKFLGNIEGTSVFDGNVDALITDGFTGNVFLKTAEGIANLILDRMGTSPSSELIDLQKHLHYGEYPGALLLGVQGIVIKCHGYSSTKAFINAIHGAISLVKKDFLNSFRSTLKFS